MASKYRKNKAKFKWTKELIILLVAVVAILTVTIILSVPSSKDKYTEKLNNAITEANAANNSSYNTLPDDHVFQSIGHEKLLKKIAGGDYVYVLYGSTNSSTILENLNFINSQAQNEEIDVIYFYSSLWVENTEDRETESFKTKKASIENDLSKDKLKDVDDFSVTDYPALLVFYEGKMIFNSQTYSDVDQYNWAMFIQKALLISKTNN